jgi:hypothetical protein
MTRILSRPEPLNGRLILGLALAVIAVAAAAAATQDGLTDAWRVAIRSTARTSLLLFLLAFVAAAWHARWPGGLSRQLAAHRRELGLAFAASHAVHACALAGLAVSDPVTFASLVNRGMWIAGGIGYAFIVAMSVSTVAAVRDHMGERAWRVLHLAGTYYLWIGFVNALARRAGDDPGYWLGVAVLVLAMVLRWLPPAPGAMRRAGR